MNEDSFGMSRTFPDLPQDALSNEFDLPAASNEFEVPIFQSLGTLNTAYND